jgi:hypothetical protein
MSAVHLEALSLIPNLMKLTCCGQAAVATSKASGACTRNWRRVFMAERLSTDSADFNRLEIRRQ